MIASQKLFDRFEKAGPSWLPIIVFSIVGLLGTILCVRSVSGLAEERLANTVKELYQIDRSSGMRTTLLHQVAVVDAESLTKIEREHYDAMKTIVTGLDFIGTVDADPAFKIDTSTKTTFDLEQDDATDRRLYCWSDADRKLILVGQFDWQQIRESVDPKLAFIAGTLFSQVTDSQETFLTTLTNPGEIPLTPNESVVHLDLSAPGAIEDLIGGHRKRLVGKNLMTFNESEFDVLLQAFLDQRAFAFARRGGFSYDEHLKQLAFFLDEKRELLSPLLVTAAQFGYRNGISKQFDQFVLEKFSRQSDVTVPSSVVIHPASCPIRIGELMNALDNRSSSNDDDPDFPGDLVDQIKSFADQPPGNEEIVQSLRNRLESSGDFEQIYHMDEPFPATVYQLTRP